MSRRLFIFGFAFASGFAVLTIEIAGARLIAPVFGLSVVPWTAVIGVILGALAFGSHLGGRLADEGRVELAHILAVAGVAGVLPLLGAGLPGAARELLGFIPGAIVSAALLFAPAVACLGAVVPYLIREDTESLGSIGRRAGDISAAATAGSIAGSFATGFILIPLMPVTVLLGVNSAFLFVLAWLCGRSLGGKELDAKVGLGVFLLPFLGVATSGQPPGTLFATQSAHSAISVTERVWEGGDTVREMWQNGGSSSAEYTDGSPAHVYARESLELLDVLGLRPVRTLVLGGAGLTLPVALRARDRDTEISVVELDPVATEVARDYFAYGGRTDGITVVHDDARAFLRRDETHFDLLYLDVFDHLLTVPWTMVTEEAFREMADRLAPQGVFMANVLSPLDGAGADFLGGLHATLRSAFTDVRLYRTLPDARPEITQNLIVVATVEPGVLPDMARRQAPIRNGARPFTDAWAPVESFQARIFLEGLRWR